jgi:hypothetical protein
MLDHALVYRRQILRWRKKGGQSPFVSFYKIENSKQSPFIKGGFRGIVSVIDPPESDPETLLPPKCKKARKTSPLAITTF